MPDYTTRGVPFALGTDPNDLTLHTQGLAEWVNDHPGVSPLTTAQRDALTGTQLWEGRVILNLTSGLLEKYDAAATVWRSASVADHGGLSGLADDDHPQYLINTRHDTTARHGAGVVDHGSIGGLADDDHPQYLRRSLLTSKGDLLATLAGGAAGRLGVGPNGQVLTADAAAAAGLKWAALPPSLQAAQGSYVGDDTASRFISVGFTPRLVVIMATSSYAGWVISSTESIAQSAYVSGSGSSLQTYAHLAVNGFYVEHVSNVATLNRSTYTHHYTAIG